MSEKPIWPSIMRGLRGRCPHCGEGRLFSGFLGLRPKCERCGLDYRFADSGDGPAIFVILGAGFVVVFAALIVEVLYRPPFWLHAALWLPLILLTSGTTVTWAHHALLENDRNGLKWGLILTIVLGALFTCVQAYEYAHAAFAFKGNIYGATFFMATGFHGAHVIIGTIFLAVCLVRAYLGHFRPDQHFGFEAAAWYWHFVDVVWLFLFTCIYVWGNAGGMME